MILKKSLVAFAAALTLTALAHADVNVGVTVSATGPAATTAPWRNKRAWVIPGGISSR